MRVVQAKSVTYWHVTTDDPDGSGEYRRGASIGCWEHLMGESWEPCYMKDEELEAAFQSYMQSNKT